MHLLVTAGPTREHLDDVRYLSNASSGRMGFECARAAARAGHRVTLITGPTNLADPPGVRTVRIVNAREMYRAVHRIYSDVRAVIATAAVSDYRPASRIRGKKKKGPEKATIALVQNPDILRSLGKRKGNRTLVGFALEVHNGVQNALKKYQEKNLDLIVLNGPSSLGSDKMNARIYGPGGLTKQFTDASKRRVATWIVSAL